MASMLLALGLVALLVIPVVVLTALGLHAHPDTAAVSGSILIALLVVSYAAWAVSLKSAFDYERSRSIAAEFKLRIWWLVPLLAGLWIGSVARSLPVALGIYIGAVFGFRIIAGWLHPLLPPRSPSDRQIGGPIRLVFTRHLPIVLLGAGCGLGLRLVLTTSLVPALGIPG